jgi:hypothetical protein
MLNCREMQDQGSGPHLSGLQSALLFESPEQMYARVFREFKPRTPVPQIQVEFRRFANANSFIQLDAGRIHVRISDLLEGAPSPVLEALAHILLAKLFRRPVARMHAHRYRLYLNRRDVRRQMHLVRQIRGRKFISGPQGSYYNLEEVFEKLNAEYFEGMLARPLLGWSRKASRSMLGHYDLSHNAIIISRLLDGPTAPPLAVEYVMFHEMLHLRYPAEHEGVRRRVHTREFHQAEKQYSRLKEAKEILKAL